MSGQQLTDGAIITFTAPGFPENWQDLTVVGTKLAPATLPEMLWPDFNAVTGRYEAVSSEYFEFLANGDFNAAIMVDGTLTNFSGQYDDGSSGGGSASGDPFITPMF